MDDDELNQLLARLEETVAAEVSAVLAEVADEFARGLNQATEIVAARFSVSSITRMWRTRVPRLMRRLMGVAETAADTAAADVDAILPDGWDNLPDRYTERTLPPQLGEYAGQTEALLNAIGGRLARVANRELAEGLNAGETVDELRARLRAAFAREGAQLGEARENRIAVTESTRAWNMATLAAAQALTGPDRPLVKQWRTRGDQRVRRTHDRVDGQVRFLDDAFTVGGFPMQAPGDPTAPPDLTISCRCTLRVDRADRTAAATPAQETPMDAITAADSEHTGAMIALMPSAEDAERLALDGGETADQLHTTLYYLGSAADWTPEQQATLIDAVREHATTGTVAAHAFGAAHWNPHGDEPVWVWNIGDNRDDRDPYALNLEDTRIAVANALVLTDGLPDIPDQYTPWSPHIAAVYDSAPTRVGDLAERCGPIRFDRIRIAFAGDYTDIPLDRSLEAAAMDNTEPMPEEEWQPPVRAWSTPTPAALAFENQETGDGRIFAPGALTWGTGPWPLQYAEEMLSGHDGAELAGAIQAMDRDGDRITGEGVLYCATHAGYEAEWLLDQQAPLGVSVDLDDVEVQFVDRTGNTDDETEPLMASLASASVLHLDDGSWIIRAHTRGEWTASGIGLTRSARTVEWITSPGSTAIPAAAIHDAFPELTAAAGDPDQPEQGTVVHSEAAGDLLMRIVRARVRGATLVTVPAYDAARIVLDPRPTQPEPEPEEEPYALAAAAGGIRGQVIAYLRASRTPVTAREVIAAHPHLDPVFVRSHLTSGAVEDKQVVRLAPGRYTAANQTADTPDPDTQPTGDTEDEMSDLEASAWRAMAELPAMPPEWFQDPTELLLDGAPGVVYDKGRVYGWVARAGEPHAGFQGRRLTVESLGKIDLTHFNRQHFALEGGGSVKAGVLVMGTGHHNDGSACETDACSWDDSRTVAAIVTVGTNRHGMWYSGAASPFLSEWDRTLFTALQASYHLIRRNNGWQLRGILAVPVPGHSTPLLASTVIERSQLALTAAATIAETEPQHDRADTTPPEGDPVGAADAVEALTAALLSPQFLDRFSAALSAREAEREREQAELDSLFNDVALIKDEIAASAAPTNKEN